MRRPIPTIGLALGLALAAAGAQACAVAEGCPMYEDRPVPSPEALPDCPPAAESGGGPCVRRPGDAGPVGPLALVVAAILALVGG